MSEAEIIYYSPIEAALMLPLMEVAHVGDYGNLWLNEDAKLIHLTLGDSDGDTERGCTSFEAIAKIVNENVQRFWPGWEGKVEHDAGRPLVFADEWDPAPSAGWKLVGTFGREVTRVDELRAHLWMEIIRAYTTANNGNLWLSAAKYGSMEPQFVAAGQKMSDAAKLLHEAVEILRPLAKPEQAKS